MHLIEKLHETFITFLRQEFGADILPSTNLLNINTDEQKQSFGNLSSNAALLLAKPLKKSPLEVAKKIATEFKHPDIVSIVVAGPGFLNIILTDAAYAQLVTDATAQQQLFFKPDPTAERHTISLEFISANPTGPLHIGHGRGGIIGDVLCNVLRFLGHSVTKEFYINDAGAQIGKLGNTFKLRCLQAAGQDITLPEDAYHGQYLAELAQECVAHYGQELFKQPDTFFADYAKEKMLANIRHTLAAYGITFDVWFSEKSLHDSGAIQQAIDELQENGYLYEKDGACWFRSTDFGDDKDRVVKKACGELTYVAADFAYLKNKIERANQELIMILGHDHHSYAVRLHAALKALKLDQHPLSIILYQLVSIKQDGELVRMSKRSAAMVTLADIIETVGRDVARFFYLNRKADAQLEFDLELALKKTDENPVFYIQYAYVRTNSILQKAAENELLSKKTDTSLPFDSDERFLIQKIITLKQLLKEIAANHQTYLLAYYTYELAQIFNRYYHTHKVLDEQNSELTHHRLALVRLTNHTLKLLLDLLGLSSPERM